MSMTMCIASHKPCQHLVICVLEHPKHVRILKQCNPNNPKCASQQLLSEHTHKNV